MTDTTKYIQQSTINILEVLTFTHPVAMGACAVGGELDNTALIENLPIVVSVYSGLSIVKSLLYLIKYNQVNVHDHQSRKMKHIFDIVLHAFSLEAGIVAAQTPFSQGGDMADLSVFFLKMAIVELGKGINNLVIPRHFVESARFAENPIDKMHDEQDLFLVKAATCFFRSLGWLALAYAYHSGWILQAAAAAFQITFFNIPAAQFALKMRKFEAENKAEETLDAQLKRSPERRVARKQRSA